MKNLIHPLVALIIIGLLTAILIRQYTNVSSADVHTNRIAIHGYIQSSLATYIAENTTYPSAENLLSQMREPITLSEGKFRATVDNKIYVLPTYSDNNCSVQNHQSTDIVKCIGNAVIS